MNTLKHRIIHVARRLVQQPPGTPASSSVRRAIRVFLASAERTACTNKPKYINLAWQGLLNQANLDQFSGGRWTQPSFEQLQVPSYADAFEHLHDAMKRFSTTTHGTSYIMGALDNLDFSLGAADYSLKPLYVPLPSEIEAHALPAEAWDQAPQTAQNVAKSFGSLFVPMAIAWVPDHGWFVLVLPAPADGGTAA